jgi:hypothetical protein
MHLLSEVWANIDGAMFFTLSMALNSQGKYELEEYGTISNVSAIFDGSRWYSSIWLLILQSMQVEST